MTRRLRISHVIVQPVLVWDDDETDELTLGPIAQPISSPVSQLGVLAGRIVAEVAAMSEAAEPPAGTVS